ncbi:MAG: GNAT family N-acetyltransferase [Myxococcaceae bacterium]
MSATVEELGPNDAEALRALLTRDTPHNLYLLGIFEEFGIVPRPGRLPFTFFGRFNEQRELTAAAFVGGDGGMVVPASNGNGELTALAEGMVGKVHLRACMGEPGAVETLVRYLGVGRPKVALSQRVFHVSADDLGPFTNPTLRPAVEADFTRLLPLAACCVKETLGRDPLVEDFEAYKARVMQRIRGRRTYVLELDGRLIFKIDIGSRSRYGAELEALYTLPDERQRGHATLSLGQIARHLLSSLPTLTLRVDENNPSLQGVARKVGFIAGRTQKLAVMEQ